MRRTRPRLWLLFLAALAVAVLVFLYRHYASRQGGEEGKIDAAVAELLQAMSLDEKIGQVIIAYFSGSEFDSTLARELRELPLGGVILFGDNIENPAQLAALTERIQQTAREGGVIPLFIAVDQEGGAVARLTEGVTVFPGNMALGAAGNEALAGASAAVTARELRLLGINFNLAPVVDVNNNPDNPVIGVRSFGSDPAQVARLGAAMVEPYRRAGVLAAAKHFPGHGDTAVDSHYGLPLIPYDLSRLESLELLPFRAMVAAGVPAVMPAHILAPGLTGNETLPASLSPRAIRYLREEIGFDGLIISDSLSMGAITGRWELEEAAVLAFQAGVDLILFAPWSGVVPEDRRKIFAALKEAVENGTISGARLDQSVKRILTAKMAYGLLDDPGPRREELNRLAAPESLAVARNIARESITLVRDRAAVFPLSPAETVPLIWPAAREAALAPLMEECPYLRPYLLPLQASAAETAELIRVLRGSPLVLAATWNLRRYPSWVDLLGALAAETELAVLSLSSPYDLLAVPRAGAFLCSYSDSEASVRALGEVLNGSLVPRGRLPVELPGIDR